MEKKLLVSKVFGRKKFRSYSEFYLALAMGKVLRDRGYMLCMDGMVVDAGSIPSNMLKYYKKLLSVGAISLEGYVREEFECSIPDTDIDISYFDRVSLFKDNGDELEWTYEYAISSYGSMAGDSLGFTVAGNTLVHIMAYYLVDVMLGVCSKRLVIRFDSHKAKSTSLYSNVYSCLQGVKWFNNYVSLDVDFGDCKVDLEYSIFYNSGFVAGHHRLYSVGEKLELMKKYGMVEGAIVQLWEREGMCDSNKAGKISKVTCARINEIGDDYIGVTKIAINKTREEKIQEYNDISDEHKHYFVDVPYKKPNLEQTELSIVGIGVENHFHNEREFLTLIDEYGDVAKLISIDGKVGRVVMSCRDAIYWILCQYDIEFDRDLYRDMYFGDSEPLWDMYN